MLLKESFWGGGGLYGTFLLMLTAQMVVRTGVLSCLGYFELKPTIILDITETARRDFVI